MTLQEEIALQIEESVSGGKRNYRLSLVLVVLTIFSSAIAGLMAAIGGLPPWTVATMAILPSLASALNSVLKCETKARWYWVRAQSLKALNNQLVHENVSVIEISKSFRDILTSSEDSFPALGTVSVESLTQP